MTHLNLLKKYFHLPSGDKNFFNVCHILVKMEIVDIDTEPLTAWLESNYPQLLQYLRDNKLINEEINANKNDITLSRNRKIYYCHKCQNYMEIEANNAKYCPICGSSQLTFVKARNGVKA